MATDVVIRIKGDVSDLVAKLGLAKSNIVSFGASATKSVGDFNAALAKSAEKREALNRIGTGFGIVGAAAAVGIGLVVRAAANFDQAMSRVAATGDDARANFDALSKAAIEAGQATKFSATESADAITELIKAGVSAKDVLSGGLSGALDLAAAGELDVADAANIMATAMSQFGLKGSDATHVADLLAAAAGKAQGEVFDMAEALKYVGPVADQMGVSIDETVGTVAELANKGVLASQAGTSLRGILTALTSPSKVAAEQMKQLGINVYDARGNFIGFGGVAQQLRTHLADLTNAERDEALGRIFGNQQITAARILYAGGSADVAKWTNAVNDTGYAADTAATKMDNLAGDLEQLRGSLETAFITTGEGSQGPLRFLVQQTTDLVNLYTALPGPVKSTGLAVAGLTAVVGLSAFAATRAMTAYAGFQANLVTLGLKADTAEGAIVRGNGAMLAARGGALAAAGGLAVLSSKIDDSAHGFKSMADAAAGAFAGFAATGTPLGAGIGAGLGLLVGVLGEFSSASGEAARKAAELGDTLNEQTGAVTANTKAWLAKSLLDDGSLKAAATLGIGLDELTGAIIDQGPALDRLRAGLTEIKANGFDRVTTGAHSTAAVLDENGRAADTLLGSIGPLSDGLKTARENWALLHGGVDATTAGYLKLSGSQKAVVQTGAEAFRTGQAFIDTAERGSLTLSKYGTYIADASTGNDEFSSAADKAALAAANQADAMGEIVDKAEGVAGALHALLDPEIGVAEATDTWRAGLRHLADGLSDTTNKLRGNNDEAAKNREVVRGQVTNLLSLLDAQAKVYQSDAKVGDGNRQLTAQLQEGRKALVEQGVAAGISRDKMNAYLDVLGLTPDLVKTLIAAETDKANSDIDKTDSKLNALDGKTAHTHITTEASAAQSIINAVNNALNILDGKTAHTYVTTTESHVVSTSPAPSAAKPKAGGGPIYGPGGPRDDKAGLYALSNNEYVQPADSVAFYGVGFMDAIRRKAIPRMADGGVVGLAKGGTPPGHSTDLGDVIRLLLRGDLPATLGSVAAALRDMRAEARDVTEAERDLKAAREATRQSSHNQRQIEHDLAQATDAATKSADDYKSVEDKIRGLRKDGKPVADDLLKREKELRQARNDDRETVKKLTQLEKHRNQAQRAAEKDEQKAERELSKQRSQLADATAKWRDEQQRLLDQAKAVSDVILAQAAVFGGSGTSTTAGGILAKLKDSVKAGHTFDKDIDILRRRGLDKDLLEQFLAEGSTPEGVAAVESLVHAPRSVLAAINRQQRELERLAARVGSKSVAEREHHRRRGHHHNGRGSDSIAAGEYGGRGDGDVNINFNGPVSTNDVDRLAEKLAEKSRRRLRLVRTP